MSINRKYQIFISSTYTDLVEERRQVQDSILRMSHFPVGMELFSAASEDQWTIIKRTIDCSDYYVLIVGYRYGSIAAEGISYTQKEFEYANEKGIPILAFIRSPGQSVPQGSFEFDPEKATKLNQFVESVKDGRLVEWWDSKDDLCQKVTNALYKQFDSNPRPGWIRADETKLLEIQEELVLQNKTIRKLEDENRSLKTRIPTRLPAICVMINDEPSLNFILPKWTGKNAIETDYLPYNLEEMREDGYSPEQLVKYENFNSQLPSQDQINSYIESCRVYELSKDLSIPLSIEMENRGTTKATDVICDLYFPPDLLVYSADDIENLEKPKAPPRPKRPEEVEYEKMFGGLPRTTRAFNFDGPRLGKTTIAALNQSLDFDYHNTDWVENNTLNIRRSEIMHTRCSVIEGYSVVPLHPSKFEISGTIICGEFSEEQTFTIPVVVEAATE